MSETYAEIQVQVYVNQSALLKENFSTDARTVNVRDRIEFIDEYLATKGRSVAKERAANRKIFTQCNQINETGLSDILYKNENNDDDIITSKLSYKISEEPSDVCEKCEAKRQETKLHNKHEDAETSVFNVQTLDLQSSSTNRQINGLSTSLESHEDQNNCSVNDQSEDTANKVDQKRVSTELIGNNEISLSRLTTDSDNESTSDYDESSSGIFSDDEMEFEDEFSERTNCSKIVDKWSSNRHNKSKNNEKDKSFVDNLHERQINVNRMYNIHDNNQLILEGIATNKFFDDTHKIEINERNKMENRIYSDKADSLENLIIQELCFDLMNNILDRIESGERFQNVRRNDVCSNKLGSDITKSCSNRTHENGTDVIVVSLQGYEYTTDKNCHEQCTELDTNRSVMNTSKTEINLRKPKSTNSQNCTKSQKIDSLNSVNIERKEDLNTSLIEQQYSIESKTETLKESQSLGDQVYENSFINANITCSVLNKISSEHCKHKQITQQSCISEVTDRLETQIMVTSENNQSQTKATHDINVGKTDVTIAEDENCVDELEPGEIPDEADLPKDLSVKHKRTVPIYKENSIKYYNSKYLNSRSVYTNPRIRGSRLYYGRYNRDLRNYRSRGRSFPPRGIGTKRNIYSWSDYTDEKEKIQIINDENSLNKHDDLRKRIDENERSSYYSYRLQRRFPPLSYRDYPKYRTRPPPRRAHESERHARTSEFQRHNSREHPPRHDDDEYSSNHNSAGREHKFCDRSTSRQSDGSFHEHNKLSSSERRGSSETKTIKYKNFKITRRFSLRDETPTSKRSYTEPSQTKSKNSSSMKSRHQSSSRHLRIHRSHSETLETSHRHERKTSSERDRKTSGDRTRKRSSERERKKSVEHRRKSSSEHKRKMSLEHDRRLSSEEYKRRKLYTEDEMKSSNYHERKLASNEHEKRMSSVVAVAAFTTIDRTETSIDTPTEGEQHDSITNDCAINKDNKRHGSAIDKDAHSKCFNIIRDYAFKKAVRYSDENWDKYAKRKFLFEDELLQQLQRNYDRYLYSANDIKLQGSGPLPRFVSDELMTEAIIDTWKQPQIAASGDRQFREFDDVIGYVGYNIPCYWCEMIFADGKFVRAFPVLDPIGHRDDTMYCQTDQ